MRICWSGLVICLICIIVFSIFGLQDRRNKKSEPVRVNEPTVVSESVTEVSEPTEIATETHEGMSKSLLTGEWIDQELAVLRPVAIMTENTKSAIPQYGLEQADIIYECPVEGGITRLMAIYQDYSGMDKIGNVRSCRNYYVYFAKEFDAVYMHCGESHFAKTLLNSGFIDNVDGITGKAESYYYRDNSKKAPHNLYTSSTRIANAISGYGFRNTVDSDYEGHYQFAADGTKAALTNSIDAYKINMYYTNNKPWFEYNEADGLYYRFQFGAKQVDGNTGNQLAVTNIIIQNCDWYLWEESTGYLYVDYMSGGTGKYITNGKCIDITWKRDSESGPTRYYDGNGKEIVLNQGKTWVEIVQDTYAKQNTVSGK